MIPQSFEYISPSSLSEALKLIADGGKPLAGGHSLIPMMKLRLAAPEQIVDLNKIAELKGTRESEGHIHIGAMSTHFEILSSPVLRARCPLMVETADNIGDVQVRNFGTIGGSIAHADPAADWPAALQALEAEIHLASADGERKVSAEDFFLDTFTTALEPGELVTGIDVPFEEPSVGTAYEKMEQPASGFAIVGVAARVKKDGGKISWVRIGVTGVANAAFRASAIEQKLTGGGGSQEEIQQAVEAIVEGVDVNSDIHASANYRGHMARVYAARAIRRAVERAS